jgi:hypothetical protein
VLADGKRLAASYQALVRISNEQHLKRTKLFLISSPRNHPQDYRRRKIYAMKLTKAQQRGKKVLFLDEMAINRWATRERAWTRRGESYPNVMIHLKRESILLVCLMNERGVVRSEIVHGSTAKANYERVIDGLLAGACGEERGEKVLVVHAAVGVETRRVMKAMGEGRNL